MKPNLRVAITHDYLNQFGGAERLLLSMLEVFPSAPVYTLLYDPVTLGNAFRGYDIRSSALFNVRLAKQKYKSLFFLAPTQMERFDLRDYDLVLSSSYAWAHGARVGDDTCHICYCHTPNRYVWSMYDEYRKSVSPALRGLFSLLAHRIRRWDSRVSERVTHYVTSCATVQRRIRECYGRDSHIIPYPVDCDLFRPSAKIDSDRPFVVVSRIVEPYKKVSLVVEAFNRLGWPLVIVGDGVHRTDLEAKAKPNISFVGEKSGEELASVFSRGQALIVPGEEDFGIVAVEANAMGLPVVAFKDAGAGQDFIDGKNGIVFAEQTPESLIEALRECVGIQFDREYMRGQALRFDKAHFRDEFKSFVGRSYESHAERLSMSANN